MGCAETNRPEERVIKCRFRHDGVILPLHEFKDSAIFVRAGEKGRRDFDAERFRRLEINDKQEFGGLENPPWIGQHRERSDEAA
jgi:hypothetical protein